MEETIIQIKGVRPLDNKVRHFFKEGDITYIAIKCKGKKNPVYTVIACEVLEKDPMLIDKYVIEVKNKYYKLNSIFLGDTPESAVENYYEGIENEIF